MLRPVVSGRGARRIRLHVNRPPWLGYAVGATLSRPYPGNWAYIQYYSTVPRIEELTDPTHGEDERSIYRLDPKISRSSSTLVQSPAAKPLSQFPNPNI